MTRADRIVLVSTGGTIDKSYDAPTEQLVNAHAVVDEMVAALRLPDLEVERVELMNVDSGDMTDDERRAVVDRVRREAARDDVDGVVLTHGTTTLAVTGDLLADEEPPPTPIVLTGAMVPHVVRRSDALQNLTEALFGARVLAPGVYVVMHGRALSFPGPRKDLDSLTFVVNGP